MDLVLLHHPCEFSALDAALWEGLEEALARNLTRAIGVSNYGADDLAALEKAWTVPPAVNQCEMSVGHRDAAGLNATQARGVTYEAYEAMRGCPFDDADVVAVAAGHGVSVAQVCLRWILQHGAALAVGLGANATTIPAYAATNLDLYSFELADAEMALLDAK